ncbi:hypothetical protein Agub_g12943 [Astrephomene gubernaculifera]|uniref:Transcription initiation factor TFIID subunit 8 n=1 Tax=Astrephomene gubernaculifera TaxID=47775 RepID=A0AAD3HS79_9CHLO|nr:hypothetical protein Agub_g12943 [Astrephomene gubernaculifera]
MGSLYFTAQSASLYRKPLSRRLVTQPRAVADQSVPLYTKFSQPVYSLATAASDQTKRGSLNLITYLAPVAIKPDRCVALGLYLGTASHENMMVHRRGVLQVLQTQHAPLFQLLGKTSAKDVDKHAAIREAGYALTERYGLLTLEDAASVMEVEVISEFMPCGDHDVVICRGPGSYDQGFVHPLPPEFPVRAPGRTLPSFEERREEPPAHIPTWLPAFPDRHTYVRTPAFPGHEEDPVKQSEVIRQTRRQAAKTTLTFKQQLLAVPPHPGDVAIGSNPFLSVPTVELVGPASTAEDAGERTAAAAAAGGLSKDIVHPVSAAFEPVVGPVAEEGGPSGAGGGGGGVEDRRRDMDATVKWQQVQDAPSGSSQLGLPAGFTLDFATRVQRQGQAFAPRRIVEDALGSRGGEEPQGSRFSARARSSRYDIGDERKKAEHILAQAAEVKGHGAADHTFDD